MYFYFLDRYTRSDFTVNVPSHPWLTILHVCVCWVYECTFSIHSLKNPPFPNSLLPQSNSLPTAGEAISEGWSSPGPKLLSPLSSQNAAPSNFTPYTNILLSCSVVLHIGTRPVLEHLNILHQFINQLKNNRNQHCAVTYRDSRFATRKPPGRRSFHHISNSVLTSASFWLALTTFNLPHLLKLPSDTSIWPHSATTQATSDKQGDKQSDSCEHLVKLRRNTLPPLITVTICTHTKHLFHKLPLRITAS